MSGKSKFIPWAKPAFCKNEKKYLLRALESTWISGGYYVEEFEGKFKRRIGAKYGITVSNGTTALQLAILALGIGPGDEVIVPGFTFAAPVNMVIAAGARPVYADIDPLTWCIDPRSVEKCVTKKTKAVITVHIYGNVCEMDALKKIASKYRLSVIEDAAEAAFSKYKGKYAGTFGNAGCFSFQATKTITTGEGGFVATADRELYEKMSIIRNHGMREGRRYWHDVIGYNFRFTNLQAAVGCSQLENIKEIILKRSRAYGAYRRQLAGEKGITLQYFRPETQPAVWTLAVKTNPKVFKGSRDFLIKAMLKAGIETRPGFYPFNAMPLYGAPLLPNSEDAGANIICLPFFSSISEKEIALVCGNLKKLRK